MKTKSAPSSSPKKRDATTYAFYAFMALLGLGFVYMIAILVMM